MGVGGEGDWWWSWGAGWALFVIVAANLARTFWEVCFAAQK